VRAWLDDLLPQSLETIQESEEEQRETLRRLIEEMTT
jgi:hypothetical protein